MSPAASSKSQADLRNYVLSNITQVHNIMKTVNNSKESGTVYIYIFIFFPSAQFCNIITWLLQRQFITPGPTALVHVTHPGCMCILQGIEHPPHTQRLWSEMNLKGFGPFCCASQWIETILCVLVISYCSVNNIHHHKYTLVSSSKCQISFKQQRIDAWLAYSF